MVEERITVTHDIFFFKTVFLSFFVCLSVCLSVKTRIGLLWILGSCSTGSGSTKNSFSQEYVPFPEPLPLLGKAWFQAVGWWMYGYPVCVVDGYYSEVGVV